MEGLHDSCTPSIIRMIRSVRVRWAGNVVRIGEDKDEYMVLM
jgi:hypothetical protein